jgi:hypothetical protein
MSYKRNKTKHSIIYRMKIKKTNTEIENDEKNIKSSEDERS